MESPFGRGLKRSGNSPPSPVLDFPPILFMAIAKVVCASYEIEPNDIAPVAKRLRICVTDSTSSKGTEALTSLKVIKPRKVSNASFCSSINRQKSA